MSADTTELRSIQLRIQLKAGAWRLTQYGTEHSTMFIFNLKQGNLTGEAL